jgi:Trk K+ transport system NAD-binding subunit
MRTLLQKKGMMRTLLQKGGGVTLVAHGRQSNPINAHQNTAVKEERRITVIHH